jgi:hypothetical protein
MTARRTFAYVARLRRGGLPPAAVAGTLLVANLVGFALASPLPGGGAFQPARFRDGGRGPAVRALLAIVPAAAAVSAQSNLVPHLSQRRGIWEFPRLEDAEYVLLDARGHRSSQALAAGFERCAAALPGAGFVLLAEREGIRLYHRTGSPQLPAGCETGEPPGFRGRRLPPSSE